MSRAPSPPRCARRWARRATSSSAAPSSRTRSRAFPERERERDGEIERGPMALGGNCVRVPEQRAMDKQIQTGQGLLHLRQRARRGAEVVREDIEGHTHIIHMRTRACTYTDTYTHTCTHTLIHVYIYIYIYIYIYAHTHTHTHVLSASDC